MRDLAIASVTYDRRVEQAGGLALCDAGEETPEPGRKIRLMRPRHAQGLRQRRGEELVATRLPRLAVAVRREPVQRTIADHVGQLPVELLGPFKGQGQRERCVEMRTDTDRISEDRQIVAHSLREGARERPEV